jgi:hypothetical protein
VSGGVRAGARVPLSNVVRLRLHIRIHCSGAGLRNQEGLELPVPDAVWTDPKILIQLTDGFLFWPVV